MPERKGLTDNVMGVSPQGGNSVDTNADGESVPEVPLFYDPDTDSYLSEQAIEENADRDLTDDRREVFEEEESFRAKAGYRKT